MDVQASKKVYQNLSCFCNCICRNQIKSRSIYEEKNQVCREGLRKTAASGIVDLSIKKRNSSNKDER